MKSKKELHLLPLIEENMLGALNTILKKIIGDKKEKDLEIIQPLLKSTKAATNLFQVLQPMTFVACHTICNYVFNSMFSTWKTRLQP